MIANVRNPFLQNIKEIPSGTRIVTTENQGSSVTILVNMASFLYFFLEAFEP